ncbi:MAG: hypothetical protein KY464_17295, partial [Gemmatimonadetes bacterium]|nr:hypothetical protein [Gemmatimonadota bacterium]
MRRFARLLPLLFLGLAACEHGTEPPPAPPAAPTPPAPRVAASVEITPDRDTLDIGATLPLRAIIRDAAGDTLSGGKVAWS